MYVLIHGVAGHRSHIGHQFIGTGQACRLVHDRCGHITAHCFHLIILSRTLRPMAKTYLLLLIFTVCSMTAVMAQSKDERAIRTMLSAQVTEWNKGNIEGYMKGYWENDSLLFIGSKGPRYGYKVTLSRYKEAYPDADHMGKLTSVITRAQQLSPEYYFIVGTWALKRNAGDVSGSYTLLLRKIKGQWVIISDHSS